MTKNSQKYYRCYHCKDYKLPIKMLKKKKRHGISNICYECKKMINRKYTEGCIRDRRGNYSHTSPNRKTRNKDKLEHPHKTRYVNAIVNWVKNNLSISTDKILYKQIGLESCNDIEGNERELVSILRNHPNIKKEGIDIDSDYVKYWKSKGVNAKVCDWNNYKFTNNSGCFTICYINRFGSENDEHLIIKALSCGYSCIIDLYDGRNGSRERYREKILPFKRDYNVCFIVLPHTQDVAPNMRMVFYTKKELNLLSAEINNLAYNLYTEAPLKEI